LIKEAGLRDETGLDENARADPDLPELIAAKQRLKELGCINHDR